MARGRRASLVANGWRDASPPESVTATVGQVGDVVRLLRKRDSPGAEVEPLWRQGLGEQLRADRVRRGERIADVAQRAGVSPQYLSELERGKKDPSSEILSAVAGALEVTVAELTLSAGTRLAATRAASNRGSGPVCLAA
jgi:DNA-binding XRE family transcriptional regulator